MPSIVPVCRMSSPTRLVQRLFLFTAMQLCLATATAAEPVAVQRTDPLEASMAGEFALQGGQLPAAARHYLEAATAAQDPVLAERATRIALLADEDALARDAFRLWQALAPEGSTGQRMVAAGLALRAGDKRQARRALQVLMAEPDGWRSALAALFGAVGKQQALVAKLVGKCVDDGLLPADLQAWLGFGGLAQRLDQAKLVDRIVREVVARFPGEPRVALLRAQLLREAGKLDEARGVLSTLAGNEALSLPLRWALAGEYDALGDAGKAAQVLATGPQNDTILAQRAALLDKAGDKTALAALYAELRQGGSQPNPLRRLLLGQLAELLEHPAEALAWYETVPGAAAQGVARLRAANVRHAMGQKAAAFEALRAVQSDPLLDEDARRDGYLMEAELRQKDGDVAGERDAYARGLASFTDNLDLLYARALMWERQDDIVAAEADLRRILVIAPDNVAALNALGYTLADRTQRYREALALIDRARVAEPGNAAIIDSYGWVLFRLGKPREALEHLRHAFALQQDPDIATHLGQVLWHLGRKEEARRHFDEARRLDPDNRSLRRALQETGA